MRTKVSKAQKELYLDVKKWAVGLDVCQEVIFPWAIAPSGAGYRYDIVVPRLRLAVEYDSLLHSEYSKHFHHSKQGFIEVQLRDQIKDKLAARYGWKLIRVDERAPEGGLLVRREIERRAA